MNNKHAQKTNNPEIVEIHGVMLSTYEAQRVSSHLWGYEKSNAQDVYRILYGELNGEYKETNAKK